MYSPTRLLIKGLNGCVGHLHCVGSRKPDMTIAAGVPDRQWDVGYSDSASDVPIMRRCRKRCVINPGQRTVEKYRREFLSEAVAVACAGAPRPAAYAERPPPNRSSAPCRARPRKACRLSLTPQSASRTPTISRYSARVAPPRTNDVKACGVAERSPPALCGTRNGGRNAAAAKDGRR